ncbi:MAG: hypothetical protein PHU46_17555 [Rhodocyclaceae bacterium]|nr:hypothetical protein [Rhodocyclaceae bacterium]
MGYRCFSDKLLPAVGCVARLYSRRITKIGAAAMMALGCVALAHGALPVIRTVGPHGQYKTIAAAAAAAKSGDVVEIAAGTYSGDVAVWLQSNLTIRGVNGMVTLNANGMSAEGKAIWVIRNGNFTIENIAFSGARVPDQNGAGIRFENGNLVVRNCKFLHNENGILTGNINTATLAVERSEFGYNGHGDGYSHNIYVGQIARFSMTGSYSHHAVVGHLLKSRAKENYISYSRLTDETGGKASYEVDLPNGGTSYLIGNIIEQSATTQNSNIISFGEEGYFWPQNQLYLVNNTIVNDRTAGGVFLKVAPGTRTVKVYNNIRYGNGATLESSGTGQYAGNVLASANDLELPTAFDYRLRATSSLVGKATAPGSANNVALKPVMEYLHPLQTKVVPPSVPYSPGALQILGR